MAALGTRRPITLTSASPRSSLHSTHASSANVVTLMPPLVEAGPAPMNMSAVVSSCVGSSSAPLSIVLNPAVRGEMPWNHPPSNFSPRFAGPSVRGFDHSNAITANGPTTSSTAVA